MLPQLEKRFSGHLGQRHEAPVRQEHSFTRQNVDPGEQAGDLAVTIQLKVGRRCRAAVDVLSQIKD